MRAENIIYTENMHQQTIHTQLLIRVTNIKCVLHKTIISSMVHTSTHARTHAQHYTRSHTSIRYLLWSSFRLTSLWKTGM